MTILLPIQMEMNKTKISGNKNKEKPKTSAFKGYKKGFLKRIYKQQQPQLLDFALRAKLEHKEKNHEQQRKSSEKDLNICIKPRNTKNSNSNKQIPTITTTAATIRTLATYLNCKYLILPNSSSSGISNNNLDYNSTKYGKNSNNKKKNYNNKSHNSIISILQCKQLQNTQQQQYNDYLIPDTLMQPAPLSPALPQPVAKQNDFLTYSPHKMIKYFQDLFYILYTLLLLFSSHVPLNHLPLAQASCRYEPSRSCEAICRSNWSPTDNNNYQSTVLVTNNVTLDNFYAEDYNCTIRALVLMPDDDSYVASLKRVVPILQVAEQHIHANGLLPSYIKFDWMPQDDKCDAAFAAVKAMDGIVKNCSHVFFGPVCDYSLAAVARISKYFNSHGTPLISVGGSTFDFEKPKTKCSDEFYMLLRTGMLSFESISELTISVMKRNKWSRSIFFYDADGQRNVAGQHTCYLMMTSLGKQMRNENMTFAQYRITEKLKNRTEEMTREIGNKNSSK